MTVVSKCHPLAPMIVLRSTLVTLSVRQEAGLDGSIHAAPCLRSLS